MTERRLLALLALLIGLLAAVLLFLGFRLPGQNEDFLQWLGRVAVRGILGLIALVGSLLIYGGQYRAGGIINVVMGIVVLVVESTTAGLLLVFSGILGLVAAGTFDPYYRRR
ncbi:MAG TPA: hypothetical protein VGR51_00855 [Thermoplasmata archaeon]|nr:hypothetical protein [Thermoplasmata archaeon]